MAHGGGGKLMQQLIEKMFFSAFGTADEGEQHDAAEMIFEASKGKNLRLAFTTDSYVVQPLFFPGGDIGELAIDGTVNDLAMSGARPLYLSAGFILEEGLPMETLWQIVQSMSAAAKTAGVSIVTGDTKVVDRGKGDGIFINTAGVGRIEHDLRIAPASIQSGDVVILSGDIGRHGMAIMAKREGLEFESEIESDCAPLNDAALALIDAGIEVHCMRDLTRGGLASALIELAESCGRSIQIDERAIPVREDVRGACEILGLDPMFVANEGRMVVIVKPDGASRSLETLTKFTQCEGATIIGEIKPHDNSATKPRLLLKSVIGTVRIVDKISGEQLPRIC
jgi:hydrogenase expression/formation protein HypE